MNIIPNNKRILLEIINNLAHKHGFSISSLTHDWVLVLEKGKRSIQLVGYDWSVNSSTSQLIARDKTACYELLKHNNVPAIEQKLFLRKEESSYINMANVESELLKTGDIFGYPVVCKSNNGTGGRDVYKCSNAKELEETAQKLFHTYRSIAVSPWYDFQYEYRIIILEGKPLLAYRKERREGNWQHNLSHGAYGRMIPLGELPETFRSLAIKGAQAIGISLSSVDIADFSDHPRIIEINSGITLERFAEQGKEEYQAAVLVYETIIKYSFLN